MGSFCAAPVSSRGYFFLFEAPLLELSEAAGFDSFDSFDSDDFESDDFESEAVAVFADEPSPELSLDGAPFFPP